MHLHVTHHLDEGQFRRLERLITEEFRAMAVNAAEILAKVTANNNRLRSQGLVLEGMKEGQASITAEIAALKEQIANQQTPDLSALDNAVSEQNALIDGSDAAIGANTQPAPAEL